MATAYYDARDSLTNVEPETAKVTQIKSTVFIVSLNLGKVVFIF